MQFWECSLAKVMTEISQASCAHTISHHSHPITTKKVRVTVGGEINNKDGTLILFPLIDG